MADGTTTARDRPSVGARLGAYLRGTYAAAYLARVRAHPELAGFGVLALVTAGVFLYTAEREPTSLNYFNRLAAAFLHGRIWIDEAPSWLNELIPSGPGQWLVPYPPAPALLALPFVAVFGQDFPSQVYSALYAGLAVGVLFLVLGRLGLRYRDRVALGAVFAFGTVYWYVSIVGSAWYFAHVAAILLTVTALLLALDHRPAWAVGLLLGFAALCRLPVGLSAPFFLGALLGFPGDLRALDRRRTIRIGIGLVAGLGVAAAVYFAYNLARYGTIVDQSYTRIPGVLEDPIYVKHGILSPWYIPRNLFAILFRSWNYVDDPPFLQPSWWGLGIFLTTPLYLWLFRARLRDPRVLWTLPAIGLVLVPILTHGNVGISQFGYRFSLDFQVLLFVLLATVVAARGWTVRSATAAVASVAICAYALWAIRIGFVAY